MSLPTPPLPPPRPTGEFKRFLTRAEALTLAGMLLCIISLFLAWPAPLTLPPGVPATLYKNVHLSRSGSAIVGVKWPLMIGAILSGLLLAFPVNKSTRMALATVQGLCGLACFVTALTHFAMLPGPLLAIIGGGMLTFGALERYSQE